jgi:hypothetical protein
LKADLGAVELESRNGAEQNVFAHENRNTDLRLLELDGYVLIPEGVTDPQRLPNAQVHLVSTLFVSGWYFTARP